MSSSNVPCVLPTYKIPNKKKPERGWNQFLQTVAMIILPILLVCFFLSSVYIGSTYLHEHIESENIIANGSVGLRGTKNILKKWSISHLGGIDITNLGPPPQGKLHKTAVLEEVDSLLHGGKIGENDPNSISYKGTDKLDSSKS